MEATVAGSPGTRFYSQLCSHPSGLGHLHDCKAVGCLEQRGC